MDSDSLEQFLDSLWRRLELLEAQVQMLRERIEDRGTDIQNLYRRSEGWPIWPDEEYLNEDRDE